MVVSEEQRVRTEAGWIGVEISKSRVRTPGKGGYGLYRVRGQQVVRRTTVRLGGPTDTTEPYWAGGTWTPYAFTLEEISGEVRGAIYAGTPDGPGDVVLCDERSARGRCVYRVPTRWTSGYAGRRDLGVRGAAVTVRPEFAAQVEELARLVGDGLIRMMHVEGCACENVPERMTAACARATMPSRMAQRASNAAFQAEHLERRAYGLRERHAAKLQRNGRQPECGSC